MKEKHTACMGMVTGHICASILAVTVAFLALDFHGDTTSSTT